MESDKNNKRSCLPTFGLKLSVFLENLRAFFSYSLISLIQAYNLLQYVGLYHCNYVELIDEAIITA